MFSRKALVLVLLLLTGCGGTAGKQVAVSPTTTPLQEMSKNFAVPKLKLPSVPAGSYVPAKFIRVYRCSYVDDSGNVRKGEFIYIKVRKEEIKASF
jgi:hypothetical protein